MRKIGVSIILVSLSCILIFCLYLKQYTVIVKSVGFGTDLFYGMNCDSFEEFESWKDDRTGKLDYVTAHEITNVFDKVQVLYYFKKYGNEPELKDSGTDARVKIIVLKLNKIIDSLCLAVIDKNPIDINGRIVAGIPEMHRFFLRYVPKEYKLD